MDQINWRLVTDYLAGECSRQEEKQVSAWLAESAENRRAFLTAKRIWLASEHCNFDEQPNGDAAERDWTDLSRKLQEEEPRHPEPTHREPTHREPNRNEPNRNNPLRTPRSRQSRSRQRWSRPRRSHSFFQTHLGGLAVAAVLIIALSGGLLFGGEQSILLEGAADASQSDQFVRVITTDKGERAHLTLADGTRVTLNVDSRLELPARFDGEQREVLLDGEAYFDVVHDEERPFIVHANDASVDVVGTSFNVRSYKEEEEVSVAVSEGAVALRGKNYLHEDASLLSAGEIGRLAVGGAEVHREKTSVEQYFAWREGRLIFQEKPLSEVALQLERWYGVETSITNSSIASKRLTANLKSRSIEEVLNVIAATLNVDYEIRNDHVYFSRINN